MRRFWILFKTELNAWRHDPITILGGIIPPTFMLIAFGLLFGGDLLFEIGVVNHDSGAYGEMLIDTMNEVVSPFGIPYYAIADLSETATWDAYNSYQIEGVWVIPTDFSQKLMAEQAPQFEMHFNNYNDDRAKNHRIYAAEILWAFYQKVGVSNPPLTIAEAYPRSEIVHWFPIIAVGITLLAASLGSIFNIFALTYKEQLSGLLTEFSLAPRSLLWVLLPKTVLAMLMGMITGTFFLAVMALWLNVWPGRFLWMVWLLFGLVALFWIGIALQAGLHIRNYMAGAIASVLGVLIVFFIGGGLNMVRVNRAKVLLVAWLFPNTHVVDSLRDMILFQEWPIAGYAPILMALAFAAVTLVASFTLANRAMRHPRR
ncbi:MAG: ABC transporter permease [Chloroflexi bacterium]|nr:MAG: ABC transporter permease [Chloroflexota bacterium]